MLSWMLAFFEFAAVTSNALKPSALSIGGGKVGNSMMPDQTLDATCDCIADRVANMLLCTANSAYVPHQQAWTVRVMMSPQ